MGHEGRVEGPSAKKIVGIMNAELQKAGMPSKAEGLASVMVCAARRGICHSHAHDLYPYAIYYYA